MLNSVFQKRFNDLKTQFEEMPFRPSRLGERTYVPPGLWEQWATSAQSLIGTVFGQNGPHYTNFVKAFTKCFGYDDEVNVLKGIFLSAKEDFEGGYVFDVDLRVSGEVFGDFVAIAKQALSEGHKELRQCLLVLHWKTL